MTEYAGTGDARRSLELLWGRGVGPSRGPKPGIDAGTIARTAIELADEEGLGALSMRKVGERLGRSAMSLYTYVPGKAELIDLMLDTVLGELTGARPPAADLRAALEASARRGWEFYQRHPWVLQISGSRPALGPNELDLYESELALVDGLGLTGVDVTRVVAVVSGYVRGAAKATSDARAAAQATGLSDDDWWNARAPLLDEMVTPSWEERYPVSTRLSQEHAFDQLDRPDDTTPYTVQDALDTFEFGLQRLLDGIEVHIERQREITRGRHP